MDMKSSGYRDFMWAVNLHRLGFEILGLWPKSNECTKKSLWSEIWVGIVFVLLIFVFNIPMICTVIHVWGNMVLVINNLQITFVSLIVTVKYVIIRWKRTIFLSIVNMMAEDWMALKMDTERDVMINRARTARLIMIIGYIILLIAFPTAIISSYCGYQLIYITNSTDRHKLPLETYHFYDTNQSPQFELIFLIQSLTLLLAGIIYMCVDIFLVLTVLHICGQLENFRCRLNNLIFCKNFNKVLNNMIMTHLRLISLAYNIENTYSFMMLLMILQIGIGFCLGGFLFTIILVDGEINKAIIVKECFTILCVFGMLMNTLFYCGAGEIVIEQCNAVYRTLCDLDWYKLESRKARSLIILMVRAKYPFYITAGKIFPLTMATFCSILKSSVGYISFLLTVHG